MNYYISNNELYHFGIKGQRWGIRRFQNDDGTLTSAGKQRYSIGGLISGVRERKRIREENDARFRQNIHNKVMEIRRREQAPILAERRKARKEALQRKFRGNGLSISEHLYKTAVNAYAQQRKEFFDDIRIQRRLSRARGIKMSELTSRQKDIRKYYMDNSRAAARSGLPEFAIAVNKGVRESKLMEIAQRIGRLGY